MSHTGALIFEKKGEKNSVGKGQYFQQMVLGQLDVRIQKETNTI